MKRDVLRRLLALTRHGLLPDRPLCTSCVDADLREELASLSWGDDAKPMDTEVNGG